MQLNKVMVEYRPRLQSANVFIVFTNKINFSNNNLKINIKPTKIVININCNHYVYEINTHPYFYCHVNSLSSLNIDDNNISFRINTNQESFQHELINEQSAISTVKTNPKKININIKENQMIEIICSNCKNLLVERFVFKRVLPLPSDNMDMSEWFCHKHHSNDEDCNESISLEKLQPSNCEDLFYGHFYILIKSLIFNNYRNDNKLVYCDRCLQLLGENNLGNGTTQLWNENCLLRTISKEIIPLFNDISSAIKVNFFNLLKTLCYENNFEFQTGGFKITYKFLIETNFNNFILLDVIERNLNLFTVNCIKTDQNNNNNKNDNKFNLNKCHSYKVLFKNINKEDNNDLLKLWQEDNTIITVTISLKMFKEISTELNNNSFSIPLHFRYNNLFTLSYLGL